MPSSTPGTRPDSEKEKVINFTQQALEIELAHSQLLNWANRGLEKYGGRGLLYLFDRGYFINGLPSDAPMGDPPPPGLEGMAYQRTNSLMFWLPLSLGWYWSLAP